MRTTIEELTVPKTFYKRNRDAFGNVTREPYQKNVKRKVKVVTGWLRFGHYIIDGIIIGLILFLLRYFIQLNFGFNYSFGFTTNNFTYNFLPAIDQIIITVAYYFVCEQTMQRTIGKFATGTVVINEFAEKPDSTALLGRSFSRLVPFEALSCLSDRGWHDTWSKTYVVKIEERNELKKLLNEQKGFFLSDSEDILD